MSTGENMTVVTTVGGNLDADLAKQLRAQTAACRLMISKFGLWKSLPSEKINQAADMFDAETDSVKGSKRLLDNRSDALLEVGRIFAEARFYWKSTTVPYPERGIRLIRRSAVEEFQHKMESFKAQLEEAKQALRLAYDGLRADAQQRLGSLFNAADYPIDIAENYSLDWEFPSIEPPDYLKTLNPALYEQQEARLEARINEAMVMAENAFVEELAKLVEHLFSRLEAGEDGKAKIFRDSAVENLSSFFDRFSKLNLRSNAEFDKLVSDAKALLDGVSPDKLRKDVTVRQTVHEGLAQLKDKLDTLTVVAKPARAITFEEDEAA